MARAAARMVGVASLVLVLGSLGCDQVTVIGPVADVEEGTAGGGSTGDGSGGDGSAGGGSADDGSGDGGSGDAGSNDDGSADDGSADGDSTDDGSDGSDDDVTSDPGQVTDLAVVKIREKSVELSFTEVDDGTGEAAHYDIRYRKEPMSWGSAKSVEKGSCKSPLKGREVGEKRTCEVQGLKEDTEYEFQLVSFRGTLDQDAVFGELSNIVDAETDD